MKAAKGKYIALCYFFMYKPDMKISVKVRCSLLVVAANLSAFILTACNSSSTGQGNTTSPTPAPVSAPAGDQSAHPKQSLDYSPDEKELSKICNYLNSAGLLKADETFDIQIASSNVSTGSGPFKQDISKTSEIEGSCVPGQVVIRLSAEESDEGPFASTTTKKAAHAFSAENGTQVNSSDEYKSDFPVTTDGSGTSGNNDRVVASTQVSRLKVENSGDSFTLDYQIQGTQSPGENGTAVASVVFSVTAKFTISRPGVSFGAMNLSFTPIGSGSSSDQDFDISIPSME